MAIQDRVLDGEQDKGGQSAKKKSKTYSTGIVRTGWLLEVVTKHLFQPKAVWRSVV